MVVVLVLWKFEDVSFALEVCLKALSGLRHVCYPSGLWRGFCLWSFGLWRGPLGGSHRTLGLVARFLSLVFWLVARPTGRVSTHFGSCGEVSVFGLLACGEAPLGGPLHTLDVVARLLCLVFWLVARPSGRVSPHFGSCGEASVFGLLACGEALWEGLSTLWILWRGFCVWSFGLWRGPLGGSLQHFGSCGEASVLSLATNPKCGETLPESLPTSQKTKHRSFATRSKVWRELPKPQAKRPKIFGLWCVARLSGSVSPSLRSSCGEASFFGLWFMARLSVRVSPPFGSCGEASVFDLSRFVVRLSVSTLHLIFITNPLS